MAPVDFKANARGTGGIVTALSLLLVRRADGTAPRGPALARPPAHAPPPARAAAHAHTRLPRPCADRRRARGRDHHRPEAVGIRRRLRREVSVACRPRGPLPHRPPLRPAPRSSHARASSCPRPATTTTTAARTSLSRTTAVRAACFVFVISLPRFRAHGAPSAFAAQTSARPRTETIYAILTGASRQSAASARSSPSSRPSARAAGARPARSALCPSPRSSSSPPRSRTACWCPRPTTSES
jgi:hypothetical protein